MPEGSTSFDRFPPIAGVGRGSCGGASSSFGGRAQAAGPAPAARATHPRALDERYPAQQGVRRSASHLSEALSRGGDSDDACLDEEAAAGDDAGDLSDGELALGEEEESDGDDDDDLLEGEEDDEEASSVAPHRGGNGTHEGGSRSASPWERPRSVGAVTLPRVVAPPPSQDGDQWHNNNNNSSSAATSSNNNNRRNSNQRRNNRRNFFTEGLAGVQVQVEVANMEVDEVSFTASFPLPPLTTPNSQPGAVKRASRSSRCGARRARWNSFLWKKKAASRVVLF